MAEAPVKGVLNAAEALGFSKRDGCLNSVSDGCLNVNGGDVFVFLLDDCVT